MHRMPCTWPFFLNEGARNFFGRGPTESSLRKKNEPSWATEFAQCKRTPGEDIIRVRFEHHNGIQQLRTSQTHELFGPMRRKPCNKSTTHRTSHSVHNRWRGTRVRADRLDEKKRIRRTPPSKLRDLSLAHIIVESTSSQQIKPNIPCRM